jgi:hypothetical protein
VKHLYKPGAPIIGKFKGKPLYYASIHESFMKGQLYRVKHASFTEEFAFEYHLVLLSEIEGLSPWAEVNFNAS